MNQQQSQQQQNLYVEANNLQELLEIFNNMTLGSSKQSETKPIYPVYKGIPIKNARDFNRMVQMEMMDPYSQSDYSYNFKEMIYSFPQQKPADPKSFL